MSEDEEKTKNTEENDIQNTATYAWSKNWLVPVVLLMLQRWNSYGYELLEKIAAFGLAAINRGTFYRTLRQMEKDGMVHSSWDTSEDGPARRIYAITDAGEAYLKYWVDSLNYYQKMTEMFFHLYTGKDRPEQEEAKEPDND